MEIEQIELETRGVQVGTLHGTIEGSLRVSPKLRTLDFLNRSSAKFVRVQDSRVTNARWQPSATTSCLNVSFVLWVAELTAIRRGSPRRAAPLQNRSGVRLCLPECEILGFLHTPAQGDPILRLNQDVSPFFALTSASVIGSDVEFAAAFLAVNRAHVFAAEAFAQPDEEPGKSTDLLEDKEFAWPGQP